VSDRDILRDELMDAPDAATQIGADGSERWMRPQIPGLLAGQVSWGVLGNYLGWRASFLLICALYVCAFAGLLCELVRNPASRVGGGSGDLSTAWRNGALLMKRPRVHFVLLAVALETFATFGTFAYTGAALHLEFRFNFAAIGLFWRHTALADLSMSINPARWSRGSAPLGSRVGDPRSSRRVT
jgi:hypothetical protein